MTTPDQPPVPGTPVPDPVSLATDSARPATIGELFAALSAQVSTLISGEIELTKVKATALIKKAGTAGALLAIAAVFALYLLGWIFRSIELAIAIVLPAWAASLITAGILLLIVVIFAAIGASMLKKSSEHKPDPKAGLTKDVDAIKKGLGK
ncbi:phage holin family protein [Schaalia vaccimaxillae]|uniref:phage holin family protein n=1 Tax=Schaalia vaccimaxillae TaxID=183916 RepID=UPI0003B5312C|nr:phage holin family protein [Schaalia vaccimaxillae]